MNIYVYIYISRLFCVNVYYIIESMKKKKKRIKIEKEKGKRGGIYSE